MDDQRRLVYTVLDLARHDETKGEPDAAYWSENPLALRFPSEITDVGFGTVGATVLPGVRAFAEGCFAAIRNPNSHEDGLPELPEHEALEQLAAFSLLARWVDGATVVTASWHLVWGLTPAE